ncbi:unnamed protein product, partial [Prorocentrum cordatum]
RRRHPVVDTGRDSPPGRATDRKRPAPNNKEDAAVQGGAGLWEAPLRELGEVPPRAGDPAAPEKHHRHAWVERPAARKTAREEEQLSRQVGALSVGCSRTPPHPRQKTAHTDRENVLGSARLWSATRESGPGQEWPCQLARGAPPQRRRPGVRGGDLPVRSARTSKMFMLAQSFAADSGGAVGGCGRRAARGGGGSRSSRHLL